MSPCPRGKIRNPETNRCVNIDGAVGRRVLSTLGNRELAVMTNNYHRRPPARPPPAAGVDNAPRTDLRLTNLTPDMLEHITGMIEDRNVASLARASRNAHAMVGAPLQAKFLRSKEAWIRALRQLLLVMNAGMTAAMQTPGAGLRLGEVIGGLRVLPTDPPSPFITVFGGEITVEGVTYRVDAEAYANWGIMLSVKKNNREFMSMSRKIKRARRETVIDIAKNPVVKVAAVTAAAVALGIRVYG